MACRNIRNPGHVRHGERGQSAVETMFMVPILLLVFIGMYELFTITFAAQNAHIRAREYVLHAGFYTPSGVKDAMSEPVGNINSGGPLFDNGNYIVADTDIWGLSSAPGGGGSPNLGWRASAHDRGIRGVVLDDGDRGTYIKATAYICSPIGCPPEP